MAIAEEAAISAKWRWVRAFQYQVFVSIDQHVLLAGEGTPEHEYYAFPLIANGFDSSIREVLPATVFVGARLVFLYCQHSIEEEDWEFRKVEILGSGAQTRHLVKKKKSL